MNLLLDAHTPWLIFAPERLPQRTSDLIDDRHNELYFSRASLWELSAKMSRGRLPIPGNSVRFLIEQLDRLGIALLPIETADILRTETLPHIHSDPFDRILIAQALERDLTLVTVDKDIRRYDVPWVWN